MNDMKIKIKIVDKEHCEAVQKQLFKLGYGWSKTCKEVEYLEATHLFADNGYITYIPDGDFVYFNSDEREEVFLITDVWGPRFVTKDYWTQPITITVHGPESEQFKKAQKDLDDKTAYEPLPFHLKPRSEFLHERNVNIINVMLEYVTEGKRIPDSILSELGKNNEEIYGNDF